MSIEYRGMSMMFSARPGEQDVNEADNMPSYVTIVPTGLDNPATVPQEEEDDTAVVKVPPEEEDNAEVTNMDYNVPKTAMINGLRCTVRDCAYNTDSQVPKDAKLLLKVQFLRMHTTDVHGVGTNDQDYAQHDVEVTAEVGHVDGDAPTMAKRMDKLHESFVGTNTDITAATVAELGDANGTTVPNGWSKSSSRSNKSKNRNKSRRSNIATSQRGWSVLS